MLLRTLDEFFRMFRGHKNERQECQLKVVNIVTENSWLKIVQWYSFQLSLRRYTDSKLNWVNDNHYKLLHQYTYLKDPQYAPVIKQASLPIFGFSLFNLPESQSN